jgi:hypothetical protein
LRWGRASWLRGERRRANKTQRRFEKGEISARTDDLMHEHCSALFDVGTPKGIIPRVTRAVEYVEGGEGVYGSSSSK